MTGSGANTAELGGVWACVYELVDAEADKWNEESCKKAKIKKGGKASIKVKGVKDGNWVEVYDAKDRLLSIIHISEPTRPY